MQLSPSSEANRFSAFNKFPTFYVTRRFITAFTSARHLSHSKIPSYILIISSDTRRITAAEMKYMRRTAGYIWTDYKTNAQMAKELKITPILDKLLEYKRNCIQHVNRMPRNRLPRVMKRYSLTGRRNHGRHLRRLLDT
jgi:hypothetical protein